jgi:predicted transposase YbfD/YdcC
VPTSSPRSKPTSPPCTSALPRYARARHLWIRSGPRIRSGDRATKSAWSRAAEWADHVTAIVRVSRDTLKRVATTGLWEGTSQVAYFIADTALPASVCAQAIRDHWGIENRLHYVRDVSFREDDSRIRCNPGIFARLRSFAANILRFNSVQNMSNGRYRIALGGVNAMLSLRVM